MEIKDKVTLLVARLYQDLDLSRSNIQNIINMFQDFISLDYIPFILSKINASLQNAVSNEVTSEIELILHLHSDSFFDFSTEDKRFRFFENKGLFI